MKKICLFIWGLLLPIIVYAETTELTDYEISWGMDDDYICGISNADENYDYTNNTCNDYGKDDVIIGTYTNSTSTFEFKNNASVYLFGNDALSSKIKVNGSNTIDVIRDGNYIIEGNGELTIKGLYNYVPSTDENGNQLYFVVFDINEKQYTVKNKDGNKLTITSKEELSNIFDNVKKYNEKLENVEYSEDTYSLYNHYHMEPITINDAWIEEHITTELKKVYNDDGSITFRSSDYVSEQNIDEDDRVKANVVIPIIILTSAIIVGGTTLIIRKKVKV